MTKIIKISVRPAQTGEGLFADAPILEGSVIVEYTGVTMPTTVADTLASRFLFDLENGWTIDGEAKSNTARYVNHACDPNSEAEIEGKRVLFRAARNIAAGEEITIDYGEEYFDEYIKPYGCLCEECKKKPSGKYLTATPPTTGTNGVNR
ncbi:MAG: SET domain-containing protein [Patescibacteria group bacterium]